VTDPVALEAQDHAWQLKPGYEEFVQGVLAPHARAPEELPGAVVIKTNRIRTVVRFPDGPEGPLFVKRFRARKTGKKLLQLVRGSPAWREWRAMRSLRASGLHCPEPVVIAEEKRGGLVVGSVLATREVPDCEEVAARIRQRRIDGDADERERLARALARVSWAIFAAGADHPDMHPGNFLVRPDGELVVLDLHSVRIQSGLLGPGLRRRRLGKLAWGLGPPFTTPYHAEYLEELRWLCETYAPLDPELGDVDALFDDMHRRALKLEKVRLRSRDKRCLVKSTGFAVEEVGGRRIYRRKEVSRETVLAMLTTGAKQGQAKGQIFERRDHPVGPLRDAALRAWKAARACEVRDVRCPRALALIHEGWPMTRRGTLLLEPSDARPFSEALAGTSEPGRRRELIRSAGRLLGRFHAGGLRYDALGPEAFQVDGEGVLLAGLEGIARRRTPRDERLGTLAELAKAPLTRTERLRFWRAYLAAGARRWLAREGEGERELTRRANGALFTSSAA
jgi:hypothetical protein